MVRDRGDSATSDIFSWEPPQVAAGYSDEVAGRGDLQNKIARLIARALRDARDEGITRALVTSRMEEELGRSVSEDMLNKWASEASGAHRIPLDAFIALVKATDAMDLLGFIPAMFGFVVVPRKYKGIVELQLLEDHEREVAAHKARIQADLRAQR